MAERKASAGRRKSIILISLLFGPAFLLVFISTRSCEHKFKVLDDMGGIPSYTFEGINGRKYSNNSFKGQVVLYTTIQKSCPDSCSISLWHLDQLIYQHVRKNQKKLSHMKIVSFVVDENGKQIDKLKDVEFALKDQFEGYDPNIWILAKGDAKKLYNMSRNGENLLKSSSNFQELMLLVDKNNHLRMVLKGNSEGMVRRMKEHLALLDKQYDKEKALKKKKH